MATISTEIKGIGKTGGKLLYVNNLRTLLIALIIMLHIAITYGADGRWYYSEPTNDIVTIVALTIFTTTVQSFALGFFFMISGYFTPGSFDRKGIGLFLRDRFMRLGIPFLVYYFVISPGIFYFLYVRSMGKRVPLGEWFGSGPLWFVEVLFVFVLIYSFWRVTLRPKNGAVPDRQPPGHRELFIFAALWSLASFLVRMVFPLGYAIHNLQFAYFSGYVAFFIAGLVGYRNRWFDRFSRQVGMRWLVVAGVGILMYPVVAIAGGALEDTAPFLGGLRWQSLVFSTWEAFVGTGIVAGLLVIFRSRFDRQGKLAKAMSDNAYTAYIVHAPTVILMAYSAHQIAFHPLLKFVLAAIVGVSLCFLVSHYIVRKLPLAEKVL
jgi:surface polysaccharide O-acyltransferase-like enzyme